jgi:3,4-dihydroxy 2-butanone 4-phosphate synthase/GTP cyclohydrolase II
VKAPSKSKSISKPKSQHQSDIDSIDAVVRDVRAGKPVIVIDDAERENEGDLIIAAEKSTAESVNFMVRFGRGMICAPITQERAARLGLNRMVLDNRDR